MIGFLAVALLVLFPDSAPRRAPIDIESLNRFAEEYGIYARKMNAGVVDVKQWERVEKAWERIR